MINIAQLLACSLPIIGLSMVIVWLMIDRRIRKYFSSKHAEETINHKVTVDSLPRPTAATKAELMAHVNSTMKRNLPKRNSQLHTSELDRVVIASVSGTDYEDLPASEKKLLDEIFRSDYGRTLNTETGYVIA